MPRRSVLTPAERAALFAIAEHDDELIRRYTLSELDLSVIRQRRGASNRLGFAVQLCYLRFPGVVLGANDSPSPSVLRVVATQLNTSIEKWAEYGQREQTRREHLVELQTHFGFKPFTLRHYRDAVHGLTETATRTDKGTVLANELVDLLRAQQIILPAVNAIERICAEALTLANRQIHAAPTSELSAGQRQRLDALLRRREDGKSTMLT